TFLRGVGVTMALPWLESIPVWGDQERSVPGSSEAPVRLAVLFAGNGFHSKEWWAEPPAPGKQGQDMKLGKVLEPLADFRQKMLYSSHISWGSPTTPTPLELYPAIAFDRLFKDAASQGDQSVLDAVLSDAKDFRQQISNSDQRKLDEYLESVREVEERIAQAGKKGEIQGWRPTLAKPNIPRPPDGIPQNIAEHMRLMCDILVLAFQT